MELILYATSDSENVINKTKVEKERIDFKAKEDLNVTNPTLRLRFSDVNILFSSNYAEIPEFGRFYFIRSVQNVSRDVWALQLECDVLESFKQDFMNNNVQISRKLQDGDFYNVTMDTEVKKEIEVHKSSINLTKQKTVILSTIGGV